MVYGSGKGFCAMSAKRKQISRTYRRPKQVARRTELSESERRELAMRAVYVGSPEHKEKHWWGGLPKARQLSRAKVGRPGKQTTTICPLVAKEDQRKATEWIRCAIIAEQYRFAQTDKEFPKKVWYQANGQIWQGFLVNSEIGAYKGWPISEEERREIFG